MAKDKKSKISNLEWGIVAGAAGLIDAGQIALDAFAIGLAVNWLVDVVVGLGLLLYFWLRGVKMDWKVITSLSVAFVGGEVTAGAAPLWVGDVIYVFFKEKGLSLKSAGKLAATAALASETGGASLAAAGATEEAVAGGAIGARASGMAEAGATKEEELLARAREMTGENDDEKASRKFAKSSSEEEEPDKLEPIGPNSYR